MAQKAQFKKVIKKSEIVEESIPQTQEEVTPIVEIIGNRTSEEKFVSWLDKVITAQILAWGTQYLSKDSILPIFRSSIKI